MVDEISRMLGEFGEPDQGLFSNPALADSFRSPLPLSNSSSALARPLYRLIGQKHL